ncbi:MAG: hypothetical protein ABIP42_15185 [Planctomycetota bacterium]
MVGGGGDCQISGPGAICEAQAGNYASLFPGSNYVWSLHGNTAGAFFCGPTNLQNVCVNTTQAGSFTLQMNYTLASGPKQCDTIVTVNPALTIADLSDQAVCVGDDVVFQTSVLTGNGPYTYSWTRDTGAGAVVIPGATTDTLLLTAVGTADAGLYCVTASGQCGAMESCATLTVNECGGEEFCTLTQGAYGNANGTFNGLSHLDLVNQLLATDLVVGKPGRSLTIQAGNGACVVARLPANSGAATLPAFGNALLDTNTCQTSPTALPLKNGRFKNILLGQTITLALNTRLDVDLAGLGVCGTMVTQLMNAGPDGIHGTPDDQADPGLDGIFGTADDVTTVYISAHVIDSLATLGLPITVGGILELANRALAGQSTGTATLSEVSAAAEAINRGFDECRLLVDCH